MAEPWAKIGCEINRNPKIGEVGPEGLVVFLELVFSCIRNDRDGVIPARYSSAKHLRGLLFQYRFSTAKVQTLLDRCVRAGLIERLKDGGFYLSGWDDYWKPPMTAAERKARERAKRRQDLGLDPEPDPRGGGGRHDPPVTDVTPGRDGCHGAGHAPLGGRKEARKDRESTKPGPKEAPRHDAGPLDLDPVDPELLVRRSYLRQIEVEAAEAASRDSHPLGRGRYLVAKVAMAWHDRLARGQLHRSEVPAAILDFLVDPQTGELLERPLDPAHEPGRLAEIQAANIDRTTTRKDTPA